MNNYKFNIGDLVKIKDEIRDQFYENKKMGVIVSYHSRSGPVVVWFDNHGEYPTYFFESELDVVSKVKH